MNAATETAPIPAPRTPRGLRLVLAAVGGVLGIALVIYGAYSLLSVGASDKFDAHASYEGVRSVTIDKSGGDVELTAAPAGSPVRVTEHVTRSFSEPTRRAERTTGGGLRLSVSCGFQAADQCRVDYEISVPAGTRVNVSTSGDDIVAEGVRAASLSLSSSGGDVTARGIRAEEVSLESSGGSVSLAAVTAPRSLSATSSGGDVHLAVPDVSYALDVASSGGSVDDRAVHRDPDSPRRINAESSGGDVVIDVSR
jgi:Putative adhesin